MGESPLPCTPAMGGCGATGWLGVGAGGETVGVAVVGGDGAGRCGSGTCGVVVVAGAVGRGAGCAGGCCDAHGVGCWVTAGCVCCVPGSGDCVAVAQSHCPQLMPAFHGSSRGSKS